MGALALNPQEPQGPPLIDLACLSEEGDVQVLLAGIRLARKIVAAPAFDPFRGAEFLPGAALQEEEALRQYLREFATTIYHPVGSCKMGRDPMAVVDEATAGAWPRRAARGRRLHHAAHHQRQHQRRLHDDWREGRAMILAEDAP